MKRILVVGSLNYDTVVTVPRRPDVGETVTGGVCSFACGGKGGNQAIAAARQGGAVRLLAAVGSDEAGRIMTENLTASGVDTSSVLKKDLPSGRAFITVCDGDNSIIVAGGANDALLPADLDPALFREADYVAVSLEIPAKTALAALKKAKKYGAFTILNPTPASRVSPAFLKYTDMIVPNRGEASELTGVPVSDPDFAPSAVARLREKGVGTVLMTLGGDGSIFNDGDVLRTCPVFPVPVVDTTGAGDCFLGTVAASLAEGASLSEAVRRATAASSITVSRLGAAPSIPTREETDAFLAQR